VRSLAGRAPLHVTVVTVDDATRWPPLIESAAYYVVAEGLTNACAQASSATIRVVRDGDTLCVEVADDGCGARPRPLRSRRSRRPRRGLDGTFAVEAYGTAARPRRAAAATEDRGRGALDQGTPEAA
jgi:signal transduction histidine kinase